MSENLTLKYRPKKFEDVVGQDNIVAILRKQIESHTWKSAYLFTGAFGCGKTTMARIISNEINKTEGSAIEIDGASNNGVDNVRALIEDAQQKSLDCDYKLYIVDECHMLSTAAWNAALKLIEEPPENCIFIFCTTDPQKLPRTILSRVQRFDFGKIDTRDVVKRLSYIANKEGIANVEEEALKRLAMLADGHMRDAIKYLQQVMEQCGEVTTYNVDTIFGLVEQAALTNLFLNIKNKMANDVYARIEEVDKRGVNMVQFYDAFTDMIMDYLVYATTKNSTLVDLPNEVMDNCSDRNALYRLVGRLITYRKDVNNSNAKAMLKLIVAGEL